MSTVIAPEVQEAHDLLQGRLTTLDQERKSILGAIEALPLNGNSPGVKPKARANKAPSATPKRRQRKGRSTRADEAVALIEKEPGISASDIAKRMKIKPNYLYRVLSGLEKEGRITKDGRTYAPPKSGK